MNNIIKWINNKEYKYNADDMIKHVVKRHDFRNNLILLDTYRKGKKSFEKVIDKSK
ncbi:hypothetical protein [Clostridium beijerinckii]|nr:hypothetical protein [Clostridium beijerinckii]NRT68862.1 replication-associated recombination protein RarA [Clostridium beijerinckii]NRT84984.1 replication-associated recombination protein RarA [Clostridium beijerinckii]NRU48447.1 replication-associated recombination protein RarA [Clostridium beijerinckii]NSA12763.1 replication-associated recombination protein RarA [Clostridium beijerinckii]NSA62580.1 replication-associated recombination protein RarA [Clostridium beijerinckii]